MNNPVRALIDYLNTVQIRECARVNKQSFDSKKINQLKENIDLYINNLSQNNLIVSWPSFVGSFGGARDDFKSMLPIADILSYFFPSAKVLLVIRRQDEYIRSLYSTYLKRGGTNELHQFIGQRKNFNELIINPCLCDFNSIYMKYESLFDLMCIPYEYVFVDSERYYDEIFRFMNIDPVVISKNEKTNVGFSVGIQNFICKFNKLKMNIGRKTLLIIGCNSLLELKSKAGKNLLYKILYFFAQSLASVNFRNIAEAYQKYISKSSKNCLNLRERELILNECKISNGELDGRLINFNLKELGYY